MATVFSCGLGVHLCTCSVFYSAFLASLGYRDLLGFSLPPGSVSFLLSFGVGIRVRVRVRVARHVGLVADFRPRQHALVFILCIGT